MCNWLRDRALDRTAAHAAVALGCALPVLPRGRDAEMRSSGGLQLRMPAPELPMDLSHSMRGEERELSPNAPLATLSDAAASGVLRQLLRAVRGCRTFSCTNHFIIHD